MRPAQLVPKQVLASAGVHTSEAATTAVTVRKLFMGIVLIAVAKEDRDRLTGYLRRYTSFMFDTNLTIVGINDS